MPSASTVGVVEYITALTTQNPSIRKTLFLNLNQLQILSQTKFKASFPRLTPKQRVSVLQLMEQQQLASFSSLRDYTYEGYYTQPKVWKLMGYDFKPTNGGAPRMKPFDEAALAQVRKKPKYYREAQ